MNQQLQQFFTGYFHEDWDLDVDEPDAVVALYREENPHTSASIAQAIRLLLVESLPEQELSDFLLNDLGCYYDPGADGLTVRNWLFSIARSLEDSRPT